MFKLVYPLISLCLITFSLKMDAQFTLKGDINGYKDGKIKMIGIIGDQNYLLDSTFILNNHFELKRNENVRQGLYYLILPDAKNIQLLVDEAQQIKLSTSKEKLIQQMSFDNHVSNNLLYEGLRIQYAIDSLQQVVKVMSDGAMKKELEALLNTWFIKRNSHLENCKKNHSNEFYTAFKSAGQNPQIADVRKKDGTIDTLRQLVQYRLDFWNNVNLSDERMLNTPVLANKLRRFITELTPQNPDSIIRQADFIINKSMGNDQVLQFVTNWIALQYQPTKTTVMDGEAVYVHIIDTYFNEKTSHWFRPGELEKIKKRSGEMRASLLGKKGLDVISNDPSGKQKSLYGLTSPYVIVYMYAPHCEHCMKETPKLKKFVSEWTGDKIEVFAIALDTNAEEWNEYLQKNQLQGWTNVFDPTNRSIYAKYYVDITPEIYILNPERIIIGKNLKTDQISTVIERDKAKRK